MKKLISRSGLALVTVAVVVAGAAAFSAYEAHIVNVTATIDNATNISTDALTFGQVFPQEVLHQPVTLALSQSFTQSGALGVDYVIKQKPKCQLDPHPGTNGQLPQYAPVTENADGAFLCPDGYSKMPLLCPFLSKTSKVQGDVSVPSFHGPTDLGLWTDQVSKDTKAIGHLTQNNPSTTWDIDLHVPCFQGECAQDWASYVHEANPQANPNAYMADIANKGKQMGCDLWYELTSVNRRTPTPPPTVDGVITDGEYDGALSMPITNAGGGTVKAKTQGGFLYLAADIPTDLTDNRVIPGFNDEFGVNLGKSPVTDTIVRALGTTNANGRTFGPTDGLWSNFDPTGYEIKSLFGTGHRVLEFKIPLSAIPGVVNGDTLTIGGATESTDGNTAVYPIGLSWGVVGTYGSLLVTP